MSVSVVATLLKLKFEPHDGGVTSRVTSSSTRLLEQSGQRAWLHTPNDTAEALPLLIVLHGAGKDQMWNLKSHPSMGIEGWAVRAQTHKALVLYPEARRSTWDFISSRQTARGDVDFIQSCINSVRRQYKVDDRRIALIGLSDGGSMALSLAAHNPGLFQAAISVSGGFCASPPAASAASPKLFMMHGANDKMFPLERVGLALRDRMIAAKYRVEHRVAKGEGHVPEGWPEAFLPAWLAMGAASAAGA